jgi:hypothetical protein
MGDMEIVVFHKNDPSAETFLSCKVDDGFYKLFALIILRMGLSGDDYLNGMAWVVQYPIQPVRVSE